MKNILLFIFVIFWVVEIPAQTFKSIIELARQESLIHNQKSIETLKKFLKGTSKKRKIRFTTKKVESNFSNANELLVFISTSNEKYITGIISWTTKEYPESSSEDEFIFIFDIKNKRLFNLTSSFSYLIISGQDKEGKECVRYKVNSSGIQDYVYYQYHSKNEKIVYEEKYRWHTDYLERTKLIPKFVDKNIDTFFKSVDDKFSEMKKDKKKPMPISFDY